MPMKKSTQLIQGIAIAAALTLAAAAEGGDDISIRQHKRNLRKTKNTNTKHKLQRKRTTTKISRTNTGSSRHSVIDDEDVIFWTRLLQRQQGSMPTPPSPTPPPIPSINTPFPTDLRPVTPNPTDITPLETPSPTVTVITPSPTNSCALTSDERQSQIKSNLSVISFPDLFEQDTPQRSALNWILNDDIAQLCPDDENLVQRYTLAVFYYSTNGESWKQCSAPTSYNQASIASANSACTLTTVNATTIFPTDISGTNAWLTPSSECLWGGISCYPANTNNANKVNVVEFENNDISGTLPNEMQELDVMRFFALERGSIGGTIPNTYGQLKSLLLIDFDFNRLTGTLPESLWTLNNLRQLDLNDNRLEGTLSEDIRKLNQLRFFQLDNNRMTGNIPSGLGDIPNFSEYT